MQKTRGRESSKTDCIFFNVAEFKLFKQLSAWMREVIYLLQMALFVGLKSQSFGVFEINCTQSLENESISQFLLR